jgi:DNA-binding SARP family transcriptional activator/tetratricopeptide (TPR) repeat protein
MDFRILGPLEVWDGGRPLELRRPKHRALLAALLLRAGQVVSVDQLLDDLWGERPPPTAKGSLQNMVSGLRKLLGKTVLRTESPGYLLEVERDEIDLFRFERLFEEAQRAVGAEERVEKLREALALWRGAPLADLAFEPFVLLEAPRLEELRMTAQEELIETRLILGEHAALIPELESLVVENPFNERLRGQLMLALYRAGRQADALEVYRQARHFLVEELGLEPSTPLRELEQAMLRHDPALTPAPSRGSSLMPMRKTATVVFVDLVPSGALPARPDPEALGQLLARYSSAAQETLEWHGGTVEIPRGGALFAVFGVPQAHEDDALRTLRAASELRDELRALGGELEPRIGIGTGEVFSGDRAALVTGAVVNEAKRLEGVAAAGEILLAATTVRLVREAAELIPLDPLPLHEDRPLGVWRLLGLIEGAPAIPRRFEAPLVGRRKELAELGRAFESTVADSRCRLLVVVGEPGVGKTRLAREFAREAAQRASVFTGRCAPYGQGLTWLPLREILRAADAEAPEKLARLLSAAQDGELAARRIASAIGLAGEPAPVDETSVAFRRLFEALAARRPLVLVFEDAHWAEPTLLDVIDFLHERASGPILLLCLSRPELLDRQTGWAQRALPLAPLPEVELGELVDALEADLDPGARARVIEVAEGNPLFAEQLLAHAETEGTKSLDQPPASVEALLASRLDLLSSEDRTLLQAAAVVGRRFPRATVLELSAEDPAATDARLRSLIRTGFIHRGTIEGSLSFHHVLLRNVAYAGIPKALRADLHERIADWHERNDDPAELVGYHLEQASHCLRELLPADEHMLDLGRRAAEHLAVAAVQGIAAEDMRAAAALFARAEALLARTDRLRPELLAQLGEALAAPGWSAELARADAVLAEAIEVARGLDARETEWKARIERSFVQRQIDPATWMRHARSEAEEAIVFCQKQGYLHELGQAWRLLGTLENDLGHARAGEEALGHALAYARRTRDERAERRILVDLGFIAVYGPMSTADAIRLLEKSLELAVTRGRRHWQAITYDSLAILWAMRAEFVRARRFLADARVLRNDLGVSIAGSAVANAVVETLAGETAAAEAAYRSALGLYGEQGSLGFESTLAAEFAAVLVERERDDEALRLTERAETNAAADDVHAQTRWRGVRGRVLAGRGLLDDALGLAHEATQIASATDWLPLQADSLVDHGIVLRLAGRSDDAISQIERALQLYERKGHVVGAARCAALLDNGNGRFQSAQGPTPGRALRL